MGKLWLFFCAALVVPAASNWHYGHQDKWHVNCQKGTRQSPINLEKRKTDVKRFTPLQFHHYDTDYHAVVVNTGHNVRLDLVDADVQPFIRGGGLPAEYKLDHLHFHWASEHTIHSNRYPLELHLVHYADKFNSTGSALSSEYGLAVLGVLFHLADDDNEALEPMLKELSDGQDEIGKPQQLAKTIRTRDFLPDDTEGFYRYEGSLTTPDCNEAVIWTVFTEMQTISKDQLLKFESIQSNEKFKNFRGLQKLNDRVVTLMLSSRESSATTKTLSYAMLLIVLVAIVY